MPSLIIALALLVLAAPAQAQIAAVQVGYLTTEHVSQPVAGVYLAAPPAVGIRPYVIAKWSPLAERNAHKPVLITQLGSPSVLAGPLRASLGAGATWAPFRDYRPEPSVSAMAQIRTPYGLGLYGLVSFLPREEWGRSVIVGANRTVYLRR